MAFRPPHQSAESFDSRSGDGENLSVRQHAGLAGAVRGPPTSSRGRLPPSTTTSATTVRQLQDERPPSAQVIPTFPGTAPGRVSNKSSSRKKQMIRMLPFPALATALSLNTLNPSATTTHPLARAHSQLRFITRCVPLAAMRFVRRNGLTQQGTPS
jgi:hypothetical protein